MMSGKDKIGARSADSSTSAMSASPKIAVASPIEVDMQYDASTPDEYMEALDQDWRRSTLAALRQLIKEKVPTLRESIRYKMLSYEDDRGQVFALNAQKSYVSLYVGNADKVDPTGKFLAGLDRGKGCIRFKKSAKVAETGIDQFIARAAALRAGGRNIEC